jgi:hypothetical protein
MDACPLQSVGPARLLDDHPALYVTMRVLFAEGGGMDGREIGEELMVKASSERVMRKKL